MDLTTASAATFEPLLEQPFVLVGIDAAQITLSEIKVMPRQEQSRREPFALTFTGEHTEPLSQGTYEIEHPEAGSLVIFLVPVAWDSDLVSYEAIFN